MRANLEIWTHAPFNFRNSEVIKVFKKNFFHFETHFCQNDRVWSHAMNAMLGMLY